MKREKIQSRVGADLRKRQKVMLLKIVPRYHIRNPLSGLWFHNLLRGLRDNSPFD